MSTTETETETLAKIFQKPEVIEIEGVPHLILPEGYTSKPLPDLVGAPPLFTRRAARANDVRGFVDYLIRYKQATTAVYAGPNASPVLMAIIDDASLDITAHTAHRVTFGCPKTTEWLAWEKGNKQRMDQEGFAEHLSDNIADITKPAGATMLTMVQNFAEKRTTEFRSATNLRDGTVQFNYVETATQAAGKLALPETMALALPVFEGMKGRYPVEAKLRYRLKEGALSLWYELDRPDLVVRQAYEDLIAHVEKETDLKAYRVLPD